VAVHFTTDYTDFNNRSEAEMAAGKFHGEYSWVLTGWTTTSAGLRSNFHNSLKIRKNPCNRGSHFHIQVKWRAMKRNH